MRRTFIFSLATAAIAGAFVTGPAFSQATSTKSPLVGSWVFVSGGAKLPDGKSVWGENPKGLLIFTENGRYSSQILRSDLPKFASGNRLQGTPEENKAIVQGSIASYGTYTVDEAGKTFTVKWEGHTFPNLLGQSQTRSFTISGDELRIGNPAPTAGGPPSELVYKRDK